MKTLDEIPPTWSQKLPASERFELVLPVNALGAIALTAALDKETGLVWELFPDTTQRTWISAIVYCYDKDVGGRGGWHLPTIEQLRSLTDRTRTNPAIPSGHPFQNVQSSTYWSASTIASSTTGARLVYFGNGTVNQTSKANGRHVWCVRGGQGYDAY